MKLKNLKEGIQELISECEFLVMMDSLNSRKARALRGIYDIFEVDPSDRISLWSFNEKAKAIARELNALGSDAYLRSILIRPKESVEKEEHTVDSITTA